MRALGCFALALGLSACSKEPPVPDAVEHRGARITIVAPASEAVTNESISLGDSLVRAGSRALGLGEGRHRMLVFTDVATHGCSTPRDYRRRCVAPPRSSVGAHAADVNGLVRGLLWRAHHGNRALASMLASGLGQRGLGSGQWDEEPLSTDAGPVRATESSVRRFVSWVIDEHGVYKALAWYRGTDEGGSGDDVSRAFFAAIGRSFSAEFERFGEGFERPVASIGPWLADAICQGADTTALRQVTVVDRPSTRRDALESRVERLTVAAPAELVFSGSRLFDERPEHPADARRVAEEWRAAGFSVSAVACDALGGAREVSGGSSERGPSPLWLDAGRHALWIVFEPGTVQYSIAPRDAPDPVTRWDRHPWANSWSAFEFPRRRLFASLLTAPEGTPRAPSLVLTQCGVSDGWSTFRVRTDQWPLEPDGRTRALSLDLRLSPQAIVSVEPSVSSAEFRAAVRAERCVRDEALRDRCARVDLLAGATGIGRITMRIDRSASLSAWVRVTAEGCYSRDE